MSPTAEPLVGRLDAATMRLGERWPVHVRDDSASMREVRDFSESALTGRSVGCDQVIGMEWMKSIEPGNSSTWGTFVVALIAANVALFQYEKQKEAHDAERERERKEFASQLALWLVRRLDDRENEKNVGVVLLDSSTVAFHDVHVTVRMRTADGKADVDDHFTRGSSLRAATSGSAGKTTPLPRSRIRAAPLSAGS